ncbi:unnamed protein product [Diplocarpon coronariae]
MTAFGSEYAFDSSFVIVSGVCYYIIGLKGDHRSGCHVKPGSANIHRIVQATRLRLDTAH